MLMVVIGPAGTSGRTHPAGESVEYAGSGLPVLTNATNAKISSVRTADNRCLPTVASSIRRSENRSVCVRWTQRPGRRASV